MTDEITLDAPETPLERFLAAAAGVEGITLDEPVTRIEKYLYKIAQGSGGVPAVEDADKGKYLHANESTGDLEWATAGGSGSSGVLVVHETDTDPVALDKTWKEIHDAMLSGGAVIVTMGSNVIGVVSKASSIGNYSVESSTDNGYYYTDSESGYPHIEDIT